MATHQTCLKCGAPLAAGAGQDFCPKCLFLQASAGFQEHAAATPGDESPEKPSPFMARLSFGDYELLEEIGRGGMGVVYRARQRSLDRIVAIKMMVFGPGSSPELVKRFRAEAVSAAALQHPNIVAIHEVGIHEGRHFFVMDFVEGQSLAQLSRNELLTSKRAAGYLKTIAEAVHYAHERGILHRDLKPSNVLIDAQDQPRIVDFGLARRLDGASELTVTGQVLGSPNYLPPEQATARHGRVSRRTDVYALGATLYHLLTGRPPFQAESFSQTLDLVLHAEPVAPRLLNPNVPRDLETLCLKCLEKEPARRYPTAQALAEELNRFLRGEPIVARPLGMTGRVWRWSRRKPQAASLAAVAILTFLLGFAGVLWQLQLKESQRQRAETGEQFALQIACAADMNQAQLSLEEGDYGRAVSLLEKYLPGRNQSSTDLRQWEWRYLWQLCQSDDWFTLCRYTNTWIGGLAVSPDGNVLAVQKGDGVALWDLPGKRPLKELPASGRRGAMAFSPVGSLLAAANCDDTGHAEVTLWDANTGVAKPPLPHPVFVRSLSFSGDGKLLATMDSKLTIRVWEVESQSEITNFVTSSNTVGRLVRLSPDGSRLAFGDLNGGVRVLNSRTGTTCLEIPAPDPKDGQVTAIAFSPDGHILAWAVGLRMVIRLCDSETGQLRGELVGHKDWVLSLAFTPNSELLASASGDQTVRVWNIADNTVRCRLQGHLNEAWAVAFMKDGKTLISGGKDGCVRFWDVSAPHGARWPVPIPARCLAFTTNSQQFVALGQPDGSVSVWDGLSLQPIEPLPALGSNNSSVALSPDGRWLAIGDVAGNVKTWDWPARRAVTNLVYPSRVITILGFSPGGRYLWAGVQRGEILTRTGGAARALKVWQTHSWEEIQLNGIETVGVRWADFSPDDRLLALSYEDGTVKLWSLSDGKLVAALSGHSPRVERVLFSPNGWILASAGYDDFVKLWDVHKRRELMTLRSHFNHLSALAFSPDGQRLAVAGYGPNVAIKLWEPAIQRELITLEFNKRAVSPSYIIAFSPDGNTLASAVPFGPVLLWRAPSFAEIEARERKESPR